MAYTPSGRLSLGGVLTYVPSGRLRLGHTETLDRLATLTGVSPASTGFLDAHHFVTGVLSGSSPASTGLLSGVVEVVEGPAAILVGISPASNGVIDGHYHPNLADNMLCADCSPTWQNTALAQRPILSAPFRNAPDLREPWRTTWNAAQDRFQVARWRWKAADPMSADQHVAWTRAERVLANLLVDWNLSPRVTSALSEAWRLANPRSEASQPRFRAILPRITRAMEDGWHPGLLASNTLREDFTLGRMLVEAWEAVWQHAGLPWNARNPGPIIPPITHWPWGSRLHLRCPRPGGRLHLGRSPCIIIAERELPIQPSYLAVNNAALVRLPDRVPLPCTSMTIKTDSSSWCWQLDASLSGPDAFDLIKPTESGYPREVEATINGWVWTFVLEIPSRDQSFNKTNLKCTGWSTSVWLDAPYTLSTTGKNPNARTANQLAEEALLDTGWSIDWGLDDWLIPSRRFEWENTKLGRIQRLLKPVQGCLYTDPSQKILYATAKYPTPSWLWESLTADVNIPNTLILSLKSTPIFTTTYNGVYVSGTSDGVLAWVRIAGTDGMTQPDQPIVEALCCDEYGVAARMAGIAFLSSCGLGWTLSLNTILAQQTGGDGVPLLRPGQLVSIQSHKSMVRGVSINASHSGGFTGVLNVRQAVELERREIEP